MTLTVKELIERLKAFDKNLPVYMDGHEDEEDVAEIRDVGFWTEEKDKLLLWRDINE